MHLKCLLLFLLMVLSPPEMLGQDSLYRSKTSKTKVAVKELTKSLETNKSDEEVAADYVTLAKGLYGQGDYARAETYFLQAIQLLNKGKDTEILSTTYRELAQSQEKQSKFDIAIKSYTYASTVSRRKETKEINHNDANRLKNRNNPDSQASFIQKNIDLSSNSLNKEEAVTAYKQMAQVKLDLDDKEGARDELKNALSNVVDKPEEALVIQQEIAQTYLAEDEFEKAIDLDKSLVAEAKKAADPSVEIGQLQRLSDTYFSANEADKGIQVLQEAYDLAMNSAQTKDAKAILLKLTAHYRESRNSTAALIAYADFVNRLDTLIQSDSSLIDAKFFQLHEDRITQLENERVLKDLLITKTNRFNYVLLGSICLILISLFFIARALYSIRKKNKRIALQSLRREMNPHFIFNSLNSVNQFIAQNNELEANKYLSSYSRLMRNMMENSNKDFVSLSSEVKQLKEYLDLEHMRFHDKFTYQISITDSIDADSVFIPNMLIQPQLENAIWHGLRYKESGGSLSLCVEPFTQRERKFIRVTVEDNGIGLRQSRELKTKHQKLHQSRGLTNTRERIQLLNELYHIHISMEISEKEEAGSGVIVTLLFPWVDKNLQSNEHSTEDKKRNR